MKRLGPELKKPDLKNLKNVKVPPVLRDLYRDLRDRRLLPLVGLIVVALVAVPFVLSASPPPVPPPPALPAEADVSADGARLTVVEAAPGLRDPAERLARLRAKDPFKQRYTNSPAAESTSAVVSPTPLPSEGTTVTGGDTSVESGSGSGEVSEPPSEPTDPAPGKDENSDGGTGANDDGTGGKGGSGDKGNSGDKGGSTPDGEIVFYTFAIDVKITRAEPKANGGTDRTAPRVHEGVLPATSLPGKKAQVVTYMGISPKTRRPLFLVSTDVTAVFGDGRCVAGSDSCQLLEIEPGFPQTFVYGANAVRYKINVLDIEPVETGHS